MVTGWQRIADPAIAKWAAAALPLAVAGLQAEVRRCGGTWAVGLELLGNDASGAVGGCALPWQVLPLTRVPLHRAQVSAVYPGYPQPSVGESAAAFGFRLLRDAAHLDGLLPVGPERRRMVREPHGWILGIALNDCGAGAAPLVVWEGSHAVLRAALISALAGHPVASWGDVDLTEAYQAARGRVFATCRRVELPSRVGEAILLHRLSLHGVAPWVEGAPAPAEGRIIAYFRPLLGSVQEWLYRP